MNRDLYVSASGVARKTLSTWLSIAHASPEDLTLEPPITTAADDSLEYFFQLFQRK